MLTKELNYDLPSELIASSLRKQNESRLLVLERKTGSTTDNRFSILANTCGGAIVLCSMTQKYCGEILRKGGIRG